MIGAFIVKVLIFEVCIILVVYGAVLHCEERKRERDERARRRRHAQRKESP